MTYRTTFLSKARQEFIEASDWYEKRQTGLGDRFRQKVYDCIRSLEENPEKFREVKKSYRQADVAIFPYILIYRIHKRKKEIAIVSVFHTRRNPPKKYRK
jgi:plasmid stabilization system protein ParE